MQLSLPTQEAFKFKFPEKVLSLAFLDLRLKIPDKEL